MNQNRAVQVREETEKTARAVAREAVGGPAPAAISAASAALAATTDPSTGAIVTFGRLGETTLDSFRLA